MNHLLFVIYVVLCTWLVGRITFFKCSGLSSLQLRCYFVAKVAAAVFYGWFYHQAGGGDTWVFHEYGLEEWSKIKSNPQLFLTDIFQSNYKDKGGFFSVENSWWNDLDANVMGKLLALVDVFTGGYYYANVVLFNLLIFAGPIFIYKTARAALPGRSTWVYFLPLVAPSVLFWCSGIHKEGLLLLALGLIVWAFHQVITKGFSLQRIIGFCIGLLVLLVLRNYLLLPLLVALPAWAVACYTKANRPVIISAALIITGVLFFGLRLIHPAFDLPEIVAKRQEAFRNLGGRSAVDADSLQPNVTSFLHYAPEAVVDVFLKPLPADVHDVYTGLAAAETVGIFLLSLMSVLSIFRHQPQNGYLVFCVLFSLLLFLLIGYTVPIIGAIVRYRCLALPWLLLPAAVYLEKSIERLLPKTTRK